MGNKLKHMYTNNAVSAGFRAFYLKVERYGSPLIKCLILLGRFAHLHRNTELSRWGPKGGVKEEN